MEGKFNDSYLMTADFQQYTFRHAYKLREMIHDFKRRCLINDYTERCNMIYAGMLTAYKRIGIIEKYYEYAAKADIEKERIPE